MKWSRYMEKLEKQQEHNMKMHSIHKMLTADLLFYYGIKFLFLTKVKGLTASNIVLASAFAGIFKVIFQIPTTTLCEKIGNKKSLIIADLILAFSVVLVMLSNTFILLIIANLFSSIAVALREVAETTLLNLSIPETENKSKIFSKIEGKGLGNYYYLAAISAILSGFLFDINGYIPMAICVVVLLIAAKIASTFYEIKNENTEENKINSKNLMSKEYKEYFKNLKQAFSFIFHSRRLKALMVFGTVMYGMIMTMNTYEMGLLEELEVSAFATGLIYAVMQIVAGIASKKQSKIHKKFKNKTLTIIGISYGISCLIAGLISITTIPYILIITVIVITYIVRYIGTGSFSVLIKKYLTNFTNIEVADKVYSAYGLCTGIGNTVICGIGTMLSGTMDIKHSMIILSAIFTLAMLVIVNFMKTRVGLQPEEYRKKDINYKEYISLK
jgi:MFS family permease